MFVFEHLNPHFSVVLGSGFPSSLLVTVVVNCPNKLLLPTTTKLTSGVRPYSTGGSQHIRVQGLLSTHHQALRGFEDNIVLLNPTWGALRDLVRSLSVRCLFNFLCAFGSWYDLGKLNDTQLTNQGEDVDMLMPDNWALVESQNMCT